MNQDSQKRTPLFPQHIIPVSFETLKSTLIDYLRQSFRCMNPNEETDNAREQIENLLFQIKSLVFLDGEYRADAIMCRFSPWSGSNFTRRFFMDGKPVKIGVRIGNVQGMV